MSVGPSSWPTVKLSEVLRHVARPLTVKVDGTYREIGIRSHGKGLFHKAQVTGAAIGDKRVFYVEPGDFVLNIVFAWEGAVGVVSEAETGMIASHRFPCFRAIESRLDLRYLERFFHTPAGLDLLSRVSPGGAGRNRTLSRTAFMQQEISLPPLHEQEGIMARVDAAAADIGAARSLCDQQLHDAEKVLASVFSEMVVGALRLPLTLVAPLVRRPIEIVADQTYAELGIRSFGKGTFHKAHVSGLELGTKRVFAIEPGDLLFSNVFAWEGAVAVVQPADCGRIGSHRFMTCVPDRSVATAEFLCYHFLTAAGLSAMQAASPGGAGRNRTLGIGALGKLEVPMPARAEQLRFTALRFEVAQLRGVNARRTAELDALLPAILDRAFAGVL